MEKVGRRKSIPVTVGNVTIGGDAPVVVQSMTNTDTRDVKSTVSQILDLAKAGSELIRITVNTDEAAKAVPEIKNQLEKFDCNVPIVGDFHYNGHVLLTKYPECAEALAKFRINPGNVGFNEKRDYQFAVMIEQAIKYEKAVRIGVNWGSLDANTLARLMDENARRSRPKEARIVTQEAVVASAIEALISSVQC